MCGLLKVTLAKATLLFWPPERVYMGWSARSPPIPNDPRCCLQGRTRTSRVNTGLNLWGLSPCLLGQGSPGTHRCSWRLLRELQPETFLSGSLCASSSAAPSQQLKRGRKHEHLRIIPLINLDCAPHVKPSLRSGIYAEERNASSTRDTRDEERSTCK